MLLYSTIKSAHRSLCCFAVGLLGFTAAFSTQHVVGQRIRQIIPAQNPQFRVPRVQTQRPIGPPVRTYQNQIIRGPIYQQPTYYPPQGPIGPVYQAPPGTIQTVPPTQARPPVAGRLPQAVQPNQRLLDQAAEQATLDAERIRVLEKLLEKYKADAAQVQGAPTVELETLKQKNADLLKEVESQRDLAERSAFTQKERIMELSNLVEQMKTQYSQSETKIQALEKEIATAGMQDSAGKESVKTLEAQVSDLQLKVQTLSGENKIYAEQLANSKTALKTAMESQPDENEKMELVQRSQKLANENQELMQNQEAAKLEINKLKGKLTEVLEQYQVTHKKQVLMEGVNQKLQAKIAELSSDDSTISKIALVGDSVPTPVQATSFTQPSIDVSSYESKTAQLTRKNRQLVDNNADLQSEIKSLNRELTGLKQQGSEVTGSASSSLVSNSVPVMDKVASLQAVDKKGGWGILGWLIPFLAIGLGVAFFVILKEEFQRPLAGNSQRKD